MKDFSKFLWLREVSSSCITMDLRDRKLFFWWTIKENTLRHSICADHHRAFALPGFSGRKASTAKAARRIARRLRYAEILGGRYPDLREWLTSSQRSALLALFAPC
jgi:hypothetical protein